MKARFIGHLVGGVREERIGLTIGKVYTLTNSRVIGGIAEHRLYDDEDDWRRRPQSDFEPVDEPPQAARAWARFPSLCGVFA